MHEAVRELESIKTRDDVGLGAMLALVYTHKKFSNVDKESVGELDARIKEIRKRADEKVNLSNYTTIILKFYATKNIMVHFLKALYYAGYFWYTVNRPDKSKEYIDRGLKQNDSFHEVGFSNLGGNLLFDQFKK